MRAAVIERPGVVAIRDVPDPVAERGLGPDEVEIEVKAAGLCGTDWHIFRGEHGGVYPIIPGHEFAGVVSRTGSRVDPQRLPPGTPVTANPNLACGQCRFCRTGRPNHCERWQAIGVTLPGAFAERVVVPQQVVFPLPVSPVPASAMRPKAPTPAGPAGLQAAAASAQTGSKSPAPAEPAPAAASSQLALPLPLPFSVAALVEPLACVIYGWQRARQALGTGGGVGVGLGTLGGRVLILGVGPIGLMHVQMATLAGGATSIVAADLRPERLRLARELGATHTVLLPGADAGELAGDEPRESEPDEIMRELAPDGFELVIDASGSPSAVEMALTRHWVTPGGVLLVFGVAPPSARIDLSPYLVYRRDLTIIGSFAVNSTFQAALELAASGRLDLERLVSDRVPLDGFPDLLHRYGRGEIPLKAQVVY